MRSALVALAAIAIIAPAAASGQAAAGEYDNLNLPNAGGRYDLPSGSGAKNAVKQGQSSESKGDKGAVVAGTGGSSGGGDSGGGGAAVLLIVLGLVAAVCVGIAAWRLRRNGAGDDQGADAPPPPPTPQVNSGTTGESRSL